MDAKKAIVLTAALLAAFYVIVDPAGAACATLATLGWLRDGANGIFAFIQEFFART